MAKYITLWSFSVFLCVLCGGRLVLSALINRQTVILIMQMCWLQNSITTFLKN